MHEEKKGENTMAVTKKIEIDGNQVEFKASAAIPRIYRNRFGRDVYKDLATLSDAVGANDQEASNLDNFSLEMFEDLAFVMYAAAHPDEALDIVMDYVKRNKVATNRIMQKMMLREVLRLQVDRESGKREFRLRPDMVKRASYLMKEFKMIDKEVTYEELLAR